MIGLRILFLDLMIITWGGKATNVGEEMNDLVVEVFEGGIEQKWLR